MESHLGQQQGAGATNYKLTEVLQQDEGPCELGDVVEALDHPRGDHRRLKLPIQHVRKVHAHRPGGQRRRRGVAGAMGLGRGFGVGRSSFRKLVLLLLFPRLLVRLEDPLRLVLVMKQVERVNGANGPGWPKRKTERWNVLGGRGALALPQAQTCDIIRQRSWWSIPPFSTVACLPTSSTAPTYQKSARLINPAFASADSAARVARRRVSDVGHWSLVGYGRRGVRGRSGGGEGFEGFEGFEGVRPVSHSTSRQRNSP